MSHSHSHGHGHGDSANTLMLALIITAAFMLVEVVTGWWTGSLALMADAGHMLSDAGSLGVAVWAARLARRPADGTHTFGWRRAEVLGAVFNAAFLIVVAVLIVKEAVARIGSGVEIIAGPMMVVAILGLVVNIGIAWMLMRSDKDNLNVKAALLHVLGDALGSVGAIVAAGLIMAYGWVLADAIASFVIAAIVGVGAVRVLREAADVLMQSAPDGTAAIALAEALTEDEDVLEVHHLHFWAVAPGANVLTAHVVLDQVVDEHAVRDRLAHRLRAVVDLEHITLQLEKDDSACDQRTALA